MKIHDPVTAAAPGTFPSSPRCAYPVWLGSLSFLWCPVGWTLAALAPQLAFWPGIEVIHLVLPGITAVLIALNLGYGLRELWRGVAVTELFLVSALQIGLFTTLFFQLAAHLGAEHYEVTGTPGPWLWVGFSLAHALRAADVLDTIEAYGLTIQAIRHSSWVIASVVVLYHLVVDTFVLCLLHDGFAHFRSWYLRDEQRRRWTWRILGGLFVLWLLAWLGCVLWWRPWQPIDIPLWLLENVLRVVDFADIMDSYNLSLHQVPRGPIESTLTFFCRFWVALAVGYLLNRGSAAAPVPVPTPARGWNGPLGGVAVTAGLLLALVGISSFLAEREHERLAALTAAVADPDPQRAERGLRALRRLGPAAAPTIVELVGELHRVAPPVRSRVVQTLGYLGPEAREALTDLAAQNDDLGLTAVQALEPLGPEAAPTLLRIWQSTPREAVRQAAAAELQRLGPAALPPLLAAATREDLEACYHWLPQLDRNWLLHGTSNPHARRLLQLPGLLARLPALRGQEMAAAAGMLGLIGPAARQAVPELTRRLQDNDWSVREAAARALGALGAPAKPAIPELARCLDERNPLLGFAAKEALRQLGPPGQEAIPELIHCLDSSSSATRLFVAQALEPFGPQAREAVPGLTRCLGDAQPPTRLAVARTLGHIGPAAGEAIPQLAELLADSEESVFTAAEQALEKIDARWPAHPRIGTAVPRLAQRVQASPAAARALGRIGPAAVPALVKRLEINQANYFGAVAALGQMGPAARESIPALAQRLGDTETVASAALATLNKIDTHWSAHPRLSEAVPALVRLLEGGDELVRVRAAKALGLLGSAAREAVPPLGRQLRDPKAQPRVAAAEALGQIGPAARGAILRLVEVLGDGEPVASAAAQALEKIDPRWPEQPRLVEAIPQLASRMAVSAPAGQALGRLGPAAVPELTLRLNDPKTAYHAPAAQALGQIGPPAKEAILRLAELLGEADPTGSAALKALGQIDSNWAAHPGIRPLVTRHTQQLDQGTDLNRFRAARVLALIGPPAQEAVPGLERLAQNHPSALVRSMAREALDQIQRPK